MINEVLVDIKQVNSEFIFDTHRVRPFLIYGGKQFYVLYLESDE